MSYNPRLDWFLQARFGLFIHWGLYAVLGRGEWAMSRERIPWSDYEPLVNQFDASDFHPKAWAKLARDAGMKYAVLTSKHHEGFCLWHSKLCDFNAVNSPARRDLLGEYVEAFREAGLKVGLYYSLGDWRNPDWAAGWKGNVAAGVRFVDWTHAMVRELMTGYGQIDVLWYDLPQCYSAMQWRSVELNAMARSLQPNILINNRAYTTEDFATPEQHAHPSSAGRPWEVCMTLNNHWGYCPSDTAFKSATTVALQLAECASNGGNLLLNVGPDARGRIPEASAGILRTVGQWIDRCGEAITGTDRNHLMWYLFGPTTVKGETLYCFLKLYYGPEMIVGGLKNRVKSVSNLGTGQRLNFEQRGPQLFVRGIEKDDVLTVLKIEVEGKPQHDLSEVLGGADIFPVLPA
jgi:alpha-L-fucosidase